MQEYNLKVSELIQLSPTAKAIRFDLNGEQFKFNPGQFVMLQVDLEKTGKFKVNHGKTSIQKRAFSMSSCPTEKSFIEVTAKKTENAFFSKYLIDCLQKGEEFIVTGPFGQFFFDENKTIDNMILIGAGSGISPLIAILRNIYNKNLRIKTHIIFSNKNEEEILWRKEIEKISEKENISHEFTLTQNNSKNWKGKTGRITKEMIELHLQNSEKTDFYLCGPLQFVKDIEKILVLDLKIPKQNIKKEIYN